MREKERDRDRDRDRDRKRETEGERVTEGEVCPRSAVSHMATRLRKNALN